MENEEGRKEYLVFPPSKSQCPASSQKGRKIPLKGNGRRIDYILYSDEGLQQDWKLVRFSGIITVVQFLVCPFWLPTLPVSIIEYGFICCFADKKVK